VSLYDILILELIPEMLRGPLEVLGEEQVEEGLKEVRLSGSE
jgi:hypothetical protein